MVREILDPGALVQLQLGTKLSGLDGGSLRVSAVHANGWWIGDGIEDTYEGRLGAALTSTSIKSRLTAGAAAGWTSHVGHRKSDLE
jgi:hypothetical protein